MAQLLPPGSLVLVTGANGLIGSHITDQLLQLNYHVRGTVRNLEANAWLQSYFDNKYGAGKFSLARVSDFTSPNCFDSAVQGCAAFAHVASDLSESTDPNVVIPPMIAGVRHALEACAREPGMKSFVLTSSSCAATHPKPGVKFHIDRNTWGEEDVRLAWAKEWTDEGRRSWAVYGASKVQGEQALWEFVETQKPHFKVNVVCPNANFGPVLDPVNQRGSTAAWMTNVIDGHIERFAKGVKPQYYVHVQDTARLHAAVLTDLRWDGERLFAFAEPFNWNDILALLHKYVPKEKLGKVPQKIENDERDLSTVDTRSALMVLKERYGQDGWVPIETAARENVESSLKALEAQGK